jgi:hypothetical protein
MNQKGNEKIIFIALMAALMPRKKNSSNSSIGAISNHFGFCNKKPQ